MGIELAILDAVEAKLEANPTLTGKVFDNVPQGTAYPYVTIGELLANEWDTVDDTGMDCNLTIHTWSRYRGRKQTFELQSAIYDALHRAALSTPGYTVVLCDFVSSQSFVDADGLTRHGVQEFRIVIEAN